MASSSGNSENVKLTIVDQRKRKRMESNRESARRSRLRKQKHMDDLTAQVAELRMVNDQMLNSINCTTRQYINVESENSVLKAQIQELSHRLDSLDEIVKVVRTNNGFFDGTDLIPAPAVDSWNHVVLNYPIMASPDMLQF